MISNNDKAIVCLCILLSLLKPWARAELYTAIAEMEPLLETHKRIIDYLDEYITKEEERLAVLKNHLELHKIQHEKAMEDIPNYLENPINAFSLIKRLTSDLDEIDNYIKSGTEYIKNVSMIHKDMIFPTQEDLSGAVKALARLQVTYKLDVHDLAEGKLNGVAYSYPMTAADCFELCKHLYLAKDFKNSLPWSTETLRKYKEETNKKHSFTEVDVLEYIAFAHYLMDDVKTALAWTKKLLKLEPNHPRAAGNVPHYEKAIALENAANKKGTDSGIETEHEAATPHKLSGNALRLAMEKIRYESLCRGEMEINSGVAKRLFCRYMIETHPFLRLAPIKAEQVFIDPDVFVFHGVLSDDEIQLLKVLSTPRLHRALAMNAVTGKPSATNYRISKLAWLRDEDSPVVARVSQRTADITGLSMKFTEQLQVMNYGIGGQYEPHFDFLGKNDTSAASMNGKRISTLMFYVSMSFANPTSEIIKQKMSDVAQGGATVFPELGLAVIPERGAALYWRNLHPSGEGDTATRHAACPVLRGSKWVCNKWIHGAGQEFIKPCNLEFQPEEMVREIPRPRKKSSSLKI